MRIPGGPRGPERIRPGLERILAALSISGHPERSFRTVHIAGTNGKGSTACFTDAILGKILPHPVGLYTSPHLLSPEERIRVGGETIPHVEFARSAARASALSGKVAAETGEPLSYFEEMTWIACDWFRRKRVPLAVMEAGLGGRWDATNACIPEISVITNVGKDHADWLGKSLKSIASEKAGILREGTVALAGRLTPVSRRVVVSAAREKGCTLWEIDRQFRWEDAGRGRIHLHLPGISLKGVRIGMPGDFQRDNALLGFAASWWIAAARGIPGTDFAKGARLALAEAAWPGRFMPLSGRRTAGTWVDGAHNPAAAAVLVRELGKRRNAGHASRIVALWSMLGDKDIAGFLRILAPAVDGVVAFPLEEERAAPLPVLQSALDGEGASYRLANDFSAGWKLARGWAGKGGMVIVCGSLLAVAEAYRFFKGSIS